MYLVDLPGYGWARLSRGEREKLSRLVREYLVDGKPDGVVWLLDLPRDPSPDDRAMGQLLADVSVPAALVFTKADRVNRGRRSERVSRILEALPIQIAEERCVLTSAKTGEGVPELREKLDRFAAGRG